MNRLQQRARGFANEDIQGRTATKEQSKAFQDWKKHLSILAPKDGSTEIWFKFGHNQFFVGDYHPSGRFKLWATKGAGDQRVRSYCVSDAFTHLSRLAETGDGGGFYIPTQPQGLPLANCVDSTDDIGIELDSISTEEQLERYAEFERSTGLTFAVKLSSGGKSVHAHLKLDRHIPIEQARYLRRLSVLLLRADPVTVREHQPMRLGGLYRKEKGCYQEVLSYSNQKYSPEQVEAGLRRYAEYLGFEFPDRITDAWWRDCLQPIIRSSAGFTEAEKLEKIRAVLVEGLSGYEARKAAEQAERDTRQANRKLGELGKTNLVDLIEATADQLGDEAFDWNGHNWQWSNTNHARGCCPWHESQSGNSAWLHNTAEGWRFACYSCTDNRQLKPFTYWWYLEKGLKASFPTGGEFVAAAKQYLEHWGVPVPEYEYGIPPQEYIDQLLAWEQSVEQAEDNFVARAKQEQIEAFRKRTEAIQVELNTLRVLPTVKESGIYIPKEMIRLPEQPGIVLIDAPKNSGKTSNGLAAIVAQHRQRYPKAPRWLGVPRRILAMQAGNTLGLPIVGLNSQFPVREGSLCFESIFKLGDFDYLPKDQPPLLIMDEPSQTLKQLLYGGTTGGNQASVLSRLFALFKAIADRGGWIVLCEDSLTNIELDLVAEASGLEVVDYFKFEKQITPRGIKVYDSSTLIWDEIQERLYKGENLMVAGDSQRWLRELERHVVDSNILDPSEVWVIDSDSAPEPWVSELVDDPVRWTRTIKPRLVPYSPTFSSGVSIEDPDGHFSAQAFHLTHLEPRDGAQLVDRLRSNVPRFGYVKELGGSPDELLSNCRPDAILKDLDRNKEGIAKLSNFAEYLQQQERTDDLMQTMERLHQQQGDSTTDYGKYRKYFSQYKARENYNRMALRDGMIDRWKSEGHNVEFLPLGRIKHCAEERQEAREAIDFDEAKAFSATHSGDLTVEQSRQILDQLGSTKEDRRKARKRLLQDKLPGCPLDDQDFVLKVVVQNSGRFLRQAELLWLSQNPGAAQFLDRISWHGAYSHAAKRGLFVIDHKLSVRSGQAKLLNECPLEPFISGTVEKWDNDTPEAIAVKDWALLHARPFKRYLRITIKESHTPCQVLNKLLKKLGFEVEAIGRPGKRSEKRSSVYAIINLQDLDRDRILESLSERLKLECDKRQEPVPVTVGKVWIENIKLWTAKFKAAETDQDLVSAFLGMRRLYPERKHPTKQAVWERLDRVLKLRIERLLKELAAA